MNVLKLLEYIGEQEQKLMTTYIGSEFTHSQGKRDGKLQAYALIRSKINELQMEDEDTCVEAPNPFTPPRRMLTCMRGEGHAMFHHNMQKLIEKHDLTEKDVMSIHTPAFAGDTYKMYFWVSQT